MLLRGLIRGLLRALKRGIGITHGGRLVIVPAVLAENSDSVDRSSYAFAEAASPAANTLLLMEVVSIHTTTAEVPNSVSAYGLAWTQVPGGTVLHAGNGRRVTWFYAWGAAPTPGTVTIGFATLHLACAYAVIAMPGAALAAPLQAKAVSGSGNTLAIALDAALENPANVMIYSISRVANEDVVPPATGGWTELADRPITAPVGRAEVAWAAGQTAGSPTWATAGGAGAVALEVKSGP